MADPQFPNMIPGTSSYKEPKLEFVFEIKLEFPRVQQIQSMPSGNGRGAVYVESGTFAGPRLNGKAVPNSGGDYALFRPDDVLQSDGRYMLQEDDGTLILLHQKGYLWGKYADTLTKMRAYMFEDGPPVPDDEFYLRCTPYFEVEKGKHDWLMRYIFVGIGTRTPTGNAIRYYAVL